MVGRFGLILFTTLFLFGCASSNKSEKVQIDENHYKESFNKENINKNKGIVDFLNDFSKINNQKEALVFLGNPVQKIPCFLIINPKNNPSYELIEIWHWNKPINIHLLFDKEKRIHEKVQILLNFNKNKEIL